MSIERNVNGILLIFISWGLVYKFILIAHSFSFFWLCHVFCRSEDLEFVGSTSEFPQRQRSFIESKHSHKVGGFNETVFKIYNFIATMVFIVLLR